jgi:hypothetical protein
VFLYNTDATRSIGINSDKVFMTNLFQICAKVLSNRFHSRHKNTPKTHTKENWGKKKRGGPSLKISPRNCSLELQSKEACLHQLPELHQNSPLYTHIRHPRCTTYTTDHKAEGNFVKSYHHVKLGDIFPTFALFRDIAWLHLGGNRNSQNIRFTCCSIKCH